MIRNGAKVGSHKSWPKCFPNCVVNMNNTRSISARKVSIKEERNSLRDQMAKVKPIAGFGKLLEDILLGELGHMHGPLKVFGELKILVSLGDPIEEERLLKMKLVKCRDRNFI